MGSKSHRAEPISLPQWLSLRQHDHNAICHLKWILIDLLSTIFSSRKCLCHPLQSCHVSTLWPALGHLLTAVMSTWPSWVKPSPWLGFYHRDLKRQLAFLWWPKLWTQIVSDHVKKVYVQAERVMQLTGTHKIHTQRGRDRHGGIWAWVLGSDMAVAFHEECPKIFDQVFLLAKTSQGLLPVKTALTSAE